MQPMLILILLFVGMIVLVLLLRRHRLQYSSDELSAISRQHIDLFQGGQLNQAAVESAKARFRDLLERGDFAGVEASMRAGTQYVVQVRALTELGTDDAGKILERQLQRRLTDDQIEQAWYWIDLANGLRCLNRSQSLPHLLRCADAAGDMPLGPFFAAETVCFLGFGGYLRQSGTPLGRSALRVLQRAMEGLRFGVGPILVAEARMGELIEGLWDNRQERPDPLVVRVFHEALRFLRRAPHADAELGSDGMDHEAFDWQVSRLSALEPVLADYLRQVPGSLLQRLPDATAAEQGDILRALADLRADTGTEVLDLVAQAGYPHAETAVEVLQWSRDPRVAPFLRDWVLRRIAMVRRAQRRRRATSPARPSFSGIPYIAILRSLRGHPSTHSEAFLLLAARDWDPAIRQAAVASLGWWEPCARAEVLMTLQDARRDPNADVRQAARAALARLGERRALQWFRQALTGEDAQRVHDTVQMIATENLTLLWPDLDRLADSEDSCLAQFAREALERLCEDMGPPRA